MTDFKQLQMKTVCVCLNRHGVRYFLFILHPWSQLPAVKRPTEQNPFKTNLTVNPTYRRNPWSNTPYRAEPSIETPIGLVFVCYIQAGL